MSTTDSDCNLQIPPGVELEKISFKNLFSGIKFPNPRPVTPFAPSVQAYYEKGVLEVSAVLLINAEAKIKGIKVYFDSKTTSFYFSYDAPEKESSSFNAYQVTVNMNLVNKPMVINSILWDEDPVGSRGIETIVQPA